MACIVKPNHHGYLAYRLFWKGLRSWEGTGLKDTPRNRERMERKAAAMSDEIAEGSFDYLRWFPRGNKAHVFRPAEPATAAAPVTVREYAQGTWLPRKLPPMVRASLADTYRSDLRRHILPAFGDKTFALVTPAALEDFRSRLTRPVSEGGNGLKMKTARCVIDATFRALVRDARTIDRVAPDDPFAALRWPVKVDPEPDPFNEDERDRLLDYFWEKNRHYYPFVYTMFSTGLRTGEAVGLRRGDLDLRAGVLVIRRSRTMGEDNAPKTKKSRRTVTLVPEVLKVLRAMPSPLHASEDAFLFATQVGTSLDEERFVEKHWRRAVRATGVRPRKFYATRHTFMSVALTRGVNLKWLADYCGTSVDMIERHYGRFLQADQGQLALLSRRPESLAASARGGARGATVRATFRGSTKSVGRTKRRGGDSKARTSWPYAATPRQLSCILRHLAWPYAATARRRLWPKAATRGHRDSPKAVQGFGRSRHATSADATVLGVVSSASCPSSPSSHFA